MDEEVERMCENIHKSRGEQESDECKQGAWRQRHENKRQTFPYEFINEIESWPKCPLMWVSSEEIQRYAKI